jgi:hypothetical protein
MKLFVIERHKRRMEIKRLLEQTVLIDDIIEIILNFVRTEGSRIA